MYKDSFSQTLALQRLHEVYSIVDKKYLPGEVCGHLYARERGECTSTLLDAGDADLQVQLLPFHFFVLITLWQRSHSVLACRQPTAVPDPQETIDSSEAVW